MNFFSNTKKFFSVGISFKNFRSVSQGVPFCRTQYWRQPFDSLCQPKQLMEFYVIDVEDVGEITRNAGAGHVSRKHCLVDAWVVPSNQVIFLIKP